MATLYQYSIGSGHNLPLGSLTNIELLVGFELPAKTAPVNPFPVENFVLSGNAQSQGRLDHVWEFTYLKYTALDTFIDNYLVSSGTLYSSRPVTIYTRKRDRGENSYGRYNAYVHYPRPNQDYDVDDNPSDKVLNVRIRFTGLEELS